MNFEELEKTWGLQTIAGNRVIAPAIQQLLITEVGQRTHAVRRILGVVVFAFVIGWSVALTVHFTGIKPLNAVTLSVFVVGSLFDFVFFTQAILSLRRMQREAAGMGETLLDSVRGSLRVVDRQFRDCTRLMYGVLALFVGGALLFLAEYSTHNLPARGLLAGIAATAMLAAAVAATVRRYQRDELCPRRHDLQQQLNELEK